MNFTTEQIGELVDHTTAPVHPSLFETTQIQAPEYQIQTQECRSEEKRELYRSRWTRRVPFTPGLRGVWGHPGGPRETEGSRRHLKSRDQEETWTGRGRGRRLRAGPRSPLPPRSPCSRSLQSWGLGRGLRSSHRRKTRRTKKRRRL